MAASKEKTILLIALILIILFFVWGATPLVLGPYGSFMPGFAHFFKFPRIHPTFFPLVPLSLILFVLWIAVIVWVYRDAEKREMNGVLWALLVFIGNLIGLIIYLIVRTESRPREGPAAKTSACPACARPVEESHEFCPKCGTPVHRTCPKCRKAVEDEWVVCPYCGKRLEGKKTDQEGG